MSILEMTRAIGDAVSDMDDPSDRVKAYSRCQEWLRALARTLPDNEAERVYRLIRTVDGWQENAEITASRIAWKTNPR